MFFSVKCITQKVNENGGGVSELFFASPIVHE